MAYAETLIWTAGLAPSDSGHDTYFVPIFQGRIFAVQEADIFTIDVEVHKSPQFSLVITQPGLNTGAALLQSFEQSDNIAAFTFEGGLVIGELLQWSRNQYLYSHGCLKFKLEIIEQQWTTNLDQLTLNQHLLPLQPIQGAGPFQGSFKTIQLGGNGQGFADVALYRFLGF